MGHGEPTQYASRDAYAGVFIDFDAMDVAAWRGHQAGNNAPITLPVCAKLRTPAAYEDQTVCHERLRPGARVHGKGGQSAYKSPSNRLLHPKDYPCTQRGHHRAIRFHAVCIHEGRRHCGRWSTDLWRRDRTIDKVGKEQSVVSGR